MYDRICTDLPSSDPLFAPLLALCPELEMFPPLGDLPYRRYLLVSKNQDSIARARQMGIASASANPELKADLLAKEPKDLRPYLSFINDPVEGCELFIFDMGNVVVKNIHMLGKISRRLGLDKEEFKADYHNYDFAMMDGTLPIEAYWEHVRTKFGIKVEGNPFAKDFTPHFNDEIVDLIKALRSEGKRVVCGSNTFAPHWDILERMGALALFDKSYASHEMGISKPSRQFFEHILSKEKTEAGKTYFIDDYEENIVQASTMGMQCLLYNEGIRQSASEKLSEAFGL
ncbi:MAG TPA: HAD-IA family hydrolase [Sphaerochaeta sp.]|nr:HAD-IA family hydrolase [Sphaerochaeta sp.]